MKKSKKLVQPNKITDFYSEIDQPGFKTKHSSSKKLNQEYCRPVLLNNSDLLILQNLDADFIYISPQCEEITGINADNIDITSYLDRMFDKDKEKSNQIWKEAIKYKKTVLFEYRFLDNKGETRWFSHRTCLLNVNEDEELIQNNINDITIQKQFEETLLEVDKRLTVNNTLMKNKNIALEELLSQVENQKSRFNEQIQANIVNLISPLLQELLNRASRRDRLILELILNNLQSVASSFGNKISSRMYSLSTRELEICNLVKEGLSSKEISDILNIEIVTVTTHRNNIRKKLGIRNSTANLATYLNTL